MFYALSDSSTGDNPSEVTHGFANRKIAIAFKTKASRDSWIENTRLQTARPLTRAEALAYTNWQDAQNIIPGIHAGYGKVKAVRVHGITDDDGNYVYHILAEKA